MELPLIKTVNIRGTDIDVRALPFSLAIKLNDASNSSIRQLELANEVLDKCCTIHGTSEKLNIDELVCDDVALLVQIASGSDEQNF